MTGDTPLPLNSHFTRWPDFQEVLHLVITMLEVKIQQTTCTNMRHLCSRYGCRRRTVEGTGVSCVQGVYRATHRGVYKRTQHL